MTTITLPETKFMLKTKHVIPDGEEDKHKFINCICDPEYDQYDGICVVLHNSIFTKKQTKG